MSLYETTFILRPDLTTADVEKTSEGFESIVKDSGGKIIKREFWGLRDLGHKMQKNKKGYYVHLGFEAGADAIAELRRKLKISEDVIRDLTIKVEKISKEATNLED